MNILLTNDDGFSAAGIKFLEEYFSNAGHNVYVVAPDSEKSGASHSVTFTDAIKLVKKLDNKWIIRGTPADCVHVALLELLAGKIDVTVSGINLGLNIGSDIIYSGTFAAARQSAMSGVRGIALSADVVNGGIDTGIIGTFLDEHFESLYRLSSCDCVLNVNFPFLHGRPVNGIRQTSLSASHYYNDNILSYETPGQGKYFWINGEINPTPHGVENDLGAVNAGFISISAVCVMPAVVTKPLPF